MIEPLAWQSQLDPSIIETRLREVGMCWLRGVDLARLMKSPNDQWCADLGLGDAIRVSASEVSVVPGAYSYTFSAGQALLHNDQGGVWLAPDIQVMVCEVTADAGGESILLDTWEPLQELEDSDAALFHRLFTEVRDIRSVQSIYLPTIAWRGDRLVVSQAPECADQDLLGHEVDALFRPDLEVEIACLPGDVLIFNNHRVLHGRRHFDDPRRRWTRFHVWLNEPLPSPANWNALAEAAASEFYPEIVGLAPENLLHFFGFNARPRPLGSSAYRVSSAAEFVSAAELRRLVPPGDEDGFRDVLYLRDIAMLRGFVGLAESKGRIVDREEAAKIFLALSH